MSSSCNWNSSSGRLQPLLLFLFLLKVAVVVTVMMVAEVVVISVVVVVILAVFCINWNYPIGQATPELSMNWKKLGNPNYMNFLELTPFTHPHPKICLNNHKNILVRLFAFSQSLASLVRNHFDLVCVYVRAVRVCMGVCACVCESMCVCVFAKKVVLMTYLLNKHFRVTKFQGKQKSQL